VTLLPAAFYVAMTVTSLPSPPQSSATYTLDMASGFEEQLTKDEWDRESCRLYLEAESRGIDIMEGVYEFCVSKGYWHLP
jgi:hypothetical protein